jgi:hypothetical protein
MGRGPVHEKTASDGRRCGRVGGSYFTPVSLYNAGGVDISVFSKSYSEGIIFGLTRSSCLLIP